MKKEAKKRIEDIEKEIEQIASLAIKTKSESVRDVYEKRIELLTPKKENMKKDLNSSKSSIDVGNIFKKGKDMLENPLETWIKGSLQDKIILQSLIFNDNLKYSKENSFGNSETSLVYTIVINSENDNFALVEIIKNNWKHLVKELERWDILLNTRFKPLFN